MQQPLGRGVDLAPDERPDVDVRLTPPRTAGTTAPPARRRVDPRSSTRPRSLRRRRPTPHRRIAGPALTQGPASPPRRAGRSGWAAGRRRAPRALSRGGRGSRGRGCSAPVSRVNSTRSAARGAGRDGGEVRPEHRLPQVQQGPVGLAERSVQQRDWVGTGRAGQRERVAHRAEGAGRSHSSSSGSGPTASAWRVAQSSRSRARRRSARSARRRRSRAPSPRSPA